MELKLKEYLKKKIIEAIRQEKANGRKALNPVWSGLNSYIRKAYNIEPAALYDEMEREGLIKIRPMRTRDGKSFVLLYLPEDIKDKNFERWEKFFKG